MAGSEGILGPEEGTKGLLCVLGCGLRCGAQALEHKGSVVARCGLSSCGKRALCYGLGARGILIP